MRRMQKTEIDVLCYLIVYNNHFEQWIVTAVLVAFLDRWGKKGGFSQILPPTFCAQRWIQAPILICFSHAYQSESFAFGMQRSPTLFQKRNALCWNEISGAQLHQVNSTGQICGIKYLAVRSRRAETVNQGTHLSAIEVENGNFNLWWLMHSKGNGHGGIERIRVCRK